MRFRRLTLLGAIGLFSLAGGLTPATHQLTPKALAQSTSAQPFCKPVGGTLMTNLAVIDSSTTLGTATGDLAGAVSATILGPTTPGPNGTVLFPVQHHFVTAEGDTILLSPVTVATVPVSSVPGLFAIVNDQVTIVGGTGRYAGATGQLNHIGEVDFNAGHTVFRYTGQVCFSAPSEVTIAHVAEPE